MQTIPINHHNRQQYFQKDRNVLPKAALVHLYERVCSVKTRVSFCGEPFLYLECFNIEDLFYTNQQNAVD